MRSGTPPRLLEPSSQADTECLVGYCVTFGILLMGMGGTAVFSHDRLHGCCLFINYQ